MSRQDRQIIDLQHRHLLAMLALRKETQKLHHRLLPNIFKENADERGELRHLESFLPRWRPFRRRSLFAIGLEEDDKLCAYLLYMNYVIPDARLLQQSTCLVVDIAVAAQRQGRGIATALLAELCIRAERDDIDAVQANVWNGNAASKALFERAGFYLHNKCYGYLLKK